MSAMKKILLGAIVVAALCLFSPDPFNPLTSLQSAAAADNHNRQQPRLGVFPITSGASGPESLDFDPDGEGPYTGVSDGRILKWQQNGWLEYAVDSPPHLLEECRGSQDPEREHLCGRPLGLKFHKKSRNLYIADGCLGLLMVSPGHKFAEPVVTEAEGYQVNFTNGLDIDQTNGIVYFTESTMRFQRSEYESAVSTRDKTGRLIMYDIQKKEVQVLLTGLYFANGLVLSEDGSFLLIAETTTCRILRYWLAPPHTGKLEVFVHLPAMPDNIKRSPRGGFWVAMHTPLEEPLNCFSVPDTLGDVLKLPSDRILDSFGEKIVDKAPSFRISEEGEVLETTENLDTDVINRVSEVEERNGTLWFGSPLNDYMASYKI